MRADEPELVPGLDRREGERSDGARDNRGGFAGLLVAGRGRPPLPLAPDLTSAPSAQDVAAYLSLGTNIGKASRRADLAPSLACTASGRPPFGQSDGRPYCGRPPGAPDHLPFRFAGIELAVASGLRLDTFVGQI